jgi:hypothetical protein
MFHVEAFQITGFDGGALVSKSATPGKMLDIVEVAAPIMRRLA